MAGSPKPLSSYSWPNHRFSFPGKCKLKSNAEIRRRVVGQVFACAGARWRMSYDTFDEITEELQSIVEYVNRHTSGDLRLLALQLAYRHDGDVQILLPRIFGQRPGILIDPVLARPGVMDAFGTALADLLGTEWVQPTT